MAETILLAIFIAIFALLCIKRRQWAFYLLVFCLPLYVIRFQIFGLPFTLLEAMIIVLALLLIVVDGSRRKLLKNLSVAFKKIKTAGFLYPFLLLIGAATISLVVTPDLRAGLGLWRAYFIEAGIVFILFVYLIKSREELKHIYLTLGISGLGIAIFSIGQYLTKFGIPESYLSPEVRATAIYGYPAAVSLYLAPIFVLFFALVLRERDFRKSFLSYFILLGAGVGLVTTKSEGAWVAVVAACVLIGFVSLFLDNRTKKYWPAYLAAIILLTVVVMFIPQLRSNITEVLLFKDVSGDVRLVLWQGTGRLIADRPLFGAGLAGFPELYDQYKEAKHTEYLVYPHNIFLNFWVEVGLLGLVALLWLLINYFYRITKLLKKEALALPLLGVMVTVIVYGLVDAPYFKNDLSVLWWVWIGSVVVLRAVVLSRESNK